MSAPRILVVDDEADLRELLEITLLKMGLDVDSAATVREARALLGQKDYALVLTDMRLPDGMGLELVREVAGNHRNTPIAVITAYGSAENAVIALKAGAFDYVSKPVVLDDLRRMVRSALKLLDAEPGQGAAPADGSRLIGASRAMQALRAQIARLARSQAPIAINGESGSGKELAAREIHAQSARAGKPFVAVNCGAIPEALMEAEFFGYRKGAFTGANDERDGFFQAASRATLMLDEVPDLLLKGARVGDAAAAPPPAVPTPAGEPAPAAVPAAPENAALADAAPVDAADAAPPGAPATQPFAAPPPLPLGADELPSNLPDY